MNSVAVRNSANYLADYFDRHPRASEVLRAVRNEQPITIEHDGGVHSARLSLRLLQYFVINYAATHPVPCTSARGPSYVDVEYKAMLGTYRKSRFDPFCRTQSPVVSLACGVDSTVCQLNFFRWAITSHVIDYLVIHADAISDTKQHDSGTLTRLVRQRRVAKRPALPKPSIIVMPLPTNEPHTSDNGKTGSWAHPPNESA